MTNRWIDITDKVDITGKVKVLEAGRADWIVAELQWTRSSSKCLDYEICRNGEFKACIPGSSYVDRFVSPGNDSVYDVITVDENGQTMVMAMSPVTIDRARLQLSS